MDTKSKQSPKKKSGQRSAQPRQSKSAAAASPQRRASAKRAASAASTRSARSGSAGRSAYSGAAAQRAAAAAKPRKRKSNAPDVVYSAAKPFSRGKLLTSLLTVVAIVLALIFGIAIFFHVDTVTVSGANKYDEWTVREASGIQNGDNLLLINDAQIAGNITTKLPYVKSVRVGIKLPNTVNIYIEEQDIMYAIRDTGNRLWLITNEGIVVDTTNTGDAGNYPSILGVQLYKPVQSQKAIAADEEAPNAPIETNEEGEPLDTPVTIFGEDRLNAALELLQYFEKHQIIHKIVSVDVTDMGNIKVTYGQQYTINFGNKTELAYKAELVAKGIAKLDDRYNEPIGEIDVSFRVQRDLIFTFDYLTQSN